MFNKIPRSHLLAFLTVFIWAFAYVGTRVAVKFIGSLELGFMRNLVAALFFLIFLLLTKTRLVPPLRDWPLFALSGLSGYALYLILFNIGMETLSAATSCILVAIAPLISAFLASLVFKEKLNGLAWLALLISLSGVATLSLWGGVLTINAGVFWTLASSLCLGGYNVVQRYFSRRELTGKKTFTHYSSVQITAYSFFAAALLSLPLAPDSFEQFAQINFTQQSIVVLLGIFPSAVAYLCWSKALSIAVSTSSVTNYMFLTPFLTLLLGMALIAEQPNAGLLAGGALILGGLGLFSIARRR
ncbi:MAG: DMT family transporter [Deltaproteobacteria bacterium]|jgi:drug/metabolite transporter (DMT)-like permease|nr:DMT family transporter [Deltaproteobacteria bacterium]